MKEWVLAFLSSETNTLFIWYETNEFEDIISYSDLSIPMQQNYFPSDVMVIENFSIPTL